MVAKFCVLLITLYQKLLSPLFGQGKCRFYPTCSDYAIQAISRFGVIKGLPMACKRISRCHPYSEGGYDPVPPKVCGRNE